MYYNANILLSKYSITIQRQKKTHTYVYDKRVKCTKKNYELNLKSKKIINTSYYNFNNHHDYSLKIFRK